MKCLLCESLSLLHICKHCQETFLRPSLYKRKVQNIEVISFYRYQDIKNLLHTKHTDIGFYIYKILAHNSFKKFAQNFTHSDNIISIAIDDSIKSGYSHTALLNQALKSPNIKQKYHLLRASNPISYSGQSKMFRILNPRNFTLKKFKEENVILVDDIITTGATLDQAISLLKSKKKKILFCLTLADSNLKESI